MLFGTVAMSFLVSCSHKEKIEGVRENISFSNEDFSKSIDFQTQIKTSKPLNHSFFEQYADNECNLVAPFSEKDFSKTREWSFRFLSSGSHDLPNYTNVVVSKDFLHNSSKKHLDTRDLKTIVYSADAAGTIYAVDFSNGSLVWSHKTTNKNVSSGTFLCIGGSKSDTLYVTTSYCELIAFDKNTGRTKFTKKLISPAKGPAVYSKTHNILIITSVDNVTHAFNADTGAFLWEHSGMSETGGIVGLAKPAISSDIVIVTYKTGEIFALNISNGSIIWENSISKSNVSDSFSSLLAHIKASPVISNDVAYIISNAGTTLAINKSTGNIEWENKLHGGIETPFVNGNAIFFISNNDYLVALNTLNGKEFWSINLNSLTKNNVAKWYGPVLTSKGVMVLNSSGDVYYFAVRDRKLLKKISLGERFVNSPIFINGKMITVSNSKISCFK